MRQEDIEYVVNRLKRAGIDCCIDILSGLGSDTYCYVYDKNDKTILRVSSDRNEIRFVMPGALVFDYSTASCDSAELYRFCKNKEDLKTLTDEFIARNKICQELRKSFKREICRLSKVLREMAYDRASMLARIRELNKTMQDVYKVKEICIA